MVHAPTPIFPSFLLSLHWSPLSYISHSYRYYLGSLCTFREWDMKKGATPNYIVYGTQLKCLWYLGWFNKNRNKPGLFFKELISDLWLIASLTSFFSELLVIGDSQFKYQIVPYSNLCRKEVLLNFEYWFIVWDFENNYFTYLSFSWILVQLSNIVLCWILFWDT